MIYKKSIFLFLFLAFNIMFFGCATRQTFKTADIDEKTMARYLANKPEPLRPYFKGLKVEMDRNSILNHMRIGCKAFAIGKFDYAKSSFTIVREDISSVYANNEKAKKARSLWYEEGMKKFRGEPYERAMAFYYNGLLFIKEGDYENARACFKSGIIQDSFAEEKQHRCDFGLLIFLEAMMSKLLGDEQKAQDLLEHLKTIRPDFNLDANKNTLIIAETGTSPRKLADGPGHSELKFFRGKNFKEKSVEISINKKKFVPMFPIEDIYWQASTRGGREIKKILDDQVVFRQKHYKSGKMLGDISSTVIMAAPLFDNSGTASAVGGAIGLIGVANMAAAQNARPHADTRYWDNLPDTVHMFMADLSAGNHSIKWRFKDKDDNIIQGLTKQRDLKKTDSPFQIVWVSSRNR